MTFTFTLATSEQSATRWIMGDIVHYPSTCRTCRQPCWQLVSIDKLRFFPFRSYVRPSTLHSNLQTRTFTENLANRRERNCARARVTREPEALGTGYSNFANGKRQPGFRSRYARMRERSEVGGESTDSGSTGCSSGSSRESARAEVTPACACIMSTRHGTAVLRKKFGVEERSFK